MKPTFSPSILSFDHADLSQPVRQLISAGADWIHLDIMDGQFVPPITFGAETVRDLRRCGDTPFEAHLMTLTPDRHFNDFIEAGCSRIIFHVEATAHAYRLAQRLHDSKVRAGVALNPGTPVEAAIPLIEIVDLVLVMTVNPGWGGQRFLGSCLEKVRCLRSLSPTLNLEVDGGIDEQTIVEAQSAGANVFVTGSFLAEAATPGEGLQRLKRACGSK